MKTDGKTTTSVKDANGHVNKEATNEAGLTESTTDLGDGEEQITTAYSYDTNGNKIRETYADGGYKTFDYDRKNRLIKTESYEAGEAGESIGEKTLKTVYSYDINDRLLESIDYQIDGSEETAVRYTEYQYDRRGQTTGYAELSQENAPTADEIKAHQIRYHYDSDGKLTKVTYPTTKNGVHALSYEYDQNGWLTKIKGEVQSGDGNTEKTVRSYIYDSYDANGNQTDVKNTKIGQAESYTYDAENRLSKVSVTDKDGKTAVIQQNRYNGDGQRIQKVEGSKTTNYYYQDGVVSYTTDGENSQTSQNLIGTDGNILATQRYGSDHTDYLLYHKDIQGSTTSLVKEDGSADATYRYTDFGETTINGDNKAENEVCYTGGIYDQSTGLYYLNARYYNPEDARFLIEDTYRGENDKPDTQHLYVYCANNPINHVDPSGHYAVALYTLVKVVAGGVVFYVSYSTWKRRRIKTRYAGRRVTFKTRISIWLTWRAANRIMHSKGKGKKKKQSKMSEKEKSSDTPSWADGHNPKAGENGNAYAKREMEKERKTRT